MPHSAASKAQRNQSRTHIHNMCPCWSAHKYANAQSYKQAAHTHTNKHVLTHSHLVFTYEQHFHYVQHPLPKRRVLVAISSGPVSCNDNFSYFTVATTHLAVLSFIPRTFWKWIIGVYRFPSNVCKRHVHDEDGQPSAFIYIYPPIWYTYFSMASSRWQVSQL